MVSVFALFLLAERAERFMCHCLEPSSLSIIFEITLIFFVRQRELKKPARYS